MCFHLLFQVGTETNINIAMSFAEESVPFAYLYRLFWFVTIRREIKESNDENPLVSSRVFPSLNSQNIPDYDTDTRTSKVLYQ